MTRDMEIRQIGDSIEISPAHNDPTQLDDEDMRVLVKWIKANKPGILRDIMCEDCPEHNNEFWEIYR